MDFLTLKSVEQRLLREYFDLPGLTLSLAQTARLLHVDASTCQVVLNHLVDAQYLAYGESGMYVRASRDGDLGQWKTLVENRRQFWRESPFRRRPKPDPEGDGLRQLIADSWNRL